MAGEWARAATAVLLVRESLLVRRALPDAVVRRATRVLGPAPVAVLTDPSSSLAEVRRTLPRSQQWLWADAVGVGDLWRAEAAWRRRVADDAWSLLRRGRNGPESIVGAVGVLAAEAWRVQAALELAARGGSAASGVDPALEGVLR